MTNIIMTNAPNPARRQNGTTLIEVLVTVLVLAIGLLGIAALQIMSKRTNFEAAQRTTATMLAYDIIERMRANTGALGTYTGTGNVGNETLWTGEPTPTCTGSSGCTKSQLADHDMWAWEKALLGAAEKSGSNNTGGLVSPTGCITANAAVSGQYSVAIAWRGSTELSDPQDNGNPARGCGRGSGKYDGNSGTDTYRRLLVVDAYIATK